MKSWQRSFKQLHIVYRQQGQYGTSSDTTYMHGHVVNIFKAVLDLDCPDFPH